MSCSNVIIKRKFAKEPVPINRVPLIEFDDPNDVAGIAAFFCRKSYSENWFNRGLSPIQEGDILELKEARYKFSKSEGSIQVPYTNFKLVRIN